MRYLLTAICLAVAGIHVQWAAAETPQDFTVQAPIDGRKFSLKDARGKIVVLHFLLKTECPYCLRYTHSYAKESLKHKDVVHVFLKPDSDEDIQKWAKNLDLSGLQTAPVIYRDPDAKLAKAFAIPDGYKFHGQSVHYPALVTLDEHGLELFRYIGKDNSDRLSYPEFEKRLMAAQATTGSNVPRRLLPLVHASEVQQELQLSSSQITDLENCFGRLDGRWFRSRILPLDKQDEMVKMLEAEFWDSSASMLKPEQVSRLRQLELQALGTRMFLRDDVARRLKFTSSQREKLLDLVRATDTAQKKLESAEAKRQSNSELQQALSEARQSERRIASEMLTAAQRSMLGPLLGEQFDTTSLSRIYPMAPEFASGTQWFNSEPMTLEALRGKVVLVHFYAFQCHNCHANFAIYQRWHKELRDKGVVVIGIQSPETKQERDPNAVRQAAMDRGLEFPIIMDSDMENWNSWANTMWPTVYVVDKRGYLRHWWQGELNWQGATGDQVIEKVVEAALAEST